MNKNDEIVNIEGISIEKKEDKNLLEDSFNDDYQPIQRNSKLFRFILYTSKVEIKSNSFMKMVYSTSLLEISLWIVGLLLFISNPSKFYLIWVLLLHLFKGIFGLIILSNMPKTYEIMDGLYKKENVDEDKVIDMIETIMKETFLVRWNENKTKLFIYFLFTILCLITDCVIFFVQLFLFGFSNYYLTQVAIMFIIIIFFVSDIIYFLWFVTLRFTFPSFMVSPINNAIIGSMMDLKEMFFKMFRRNPASSEVSNN